MTVAVILPAAGQGVRLQAGFPKALVPIAGEPLLAHAVRAMVGAGCVDWLVVAAPAECLPLFTSIAESVVHGMPDPPRLRVVVGGDTRQASVAAALQTLPAEISVVLVHDAARPFVPREVIEGVVGAVQAGADAAVPVVPVVDTVKQVRADVVEATLSRADLRAAQTPQGFRRTVLTAAHEGVDGASSATDDAAMVERIGGKVVTVPGAVEAFKITTPFDVLIAEALVASRAEGTS